MALRIRKNMTKVCPKCSLPNPAEAAFCHNCASPLTANVGTQQQQPWPQNPVAAPVMGGQAFVAASPASQKPLIAMLLSIGGILCCGPILGVPGAILGWLELQAIREGRSPADGKLMSQVGLWVGIAATVIHIGAWIVWLLLTAVAGGGGY